MEEICVHCFVSGHVQGVFYRAKAKEKAEEFSLKGWVRNLEDGRVEVLACGSSNQIIRFYEWLQQGPPRSKVKFVSYEEIEWRDYSDFSILEHA